MKIPTINYDFIQLQFDKPKANLSVLVVFHGGGFVCLSGSRISVGPDHFLDQDIIFVVPNFRLGTLGFLSTEDEHCSGNFGFKDQVLALRWVRENIQKFGGDPER